MWYKLNQSSLLLSPQTPEGLADKWLVEASDPYSKSESTGMMKFPLWREDWWSSRSSATATEAGGQKRREEGRKEGRKEERGRKGKGCLRYEK